MLQSKSQVIEEVDSQKKQTDSIVVELENKLILMEGEKLQAKEQAENLR